MILSVRGKTRFCLPRTFHGLRGDGTYYQSGGHPLSIRWSCMGSWEAFYEAAISNGEGNVCTGEVIVQDARSCYLHGTGCLIAALRSEDMAVVETRDAVLVGKRLQLQDVKKILTELKRQKRPKYRQHPRCSVRGEVTKALPSRAFKLNVLRSIPERSFSCTCTTGRSIGSSSVERRNLPTERVPDCLRKTSPPIFGSV